MRRKGIIRLAAAAMAAVLCMTVPVYADTEKGPEVRNSQQEAGICTECLSYDVSRFVLPSDARTLVVTEGFAVNGGKSVNSAGYVEDPSLWNRARVTVFVREDAGSPWIPKIQSAAVYGWGGMSNNRHAGDGTTPIGLFRTHTPFGRREALEGFPADYTEIMISARNQYWSDETNRLEVNSDYSKQNGEKLYADWAKGIYSYALDSGYNKDNARPGTGSALFLHCTAAGKPSTAGCVAMEEEAMIGILKYYSRGACYCAIAPEGTFENVYDAYTESGEAAPGTYPASTKQLPETPLVILP